MGIEEYLDIKAKVIRAGYIGEIQWCENIWECDSPGQFFAEAAWTIINAGMKEQVARKIFDRVIMALQNRTPINQVYNHKGKCEAILHVFVNMERLFEEYKEIINVTDRLEFLEKLPYIGKITKFHLARNLGMDVVKPDRHLVSISRQYNLTPEEMCRKISEKTGDRIGVVDVVIWRACNLGIL